MNKRFLFVVLTFLLTAPCYSQIETDCSILDRSSVVKTIDTINVNAEYLEIGKIPAYKEIAYLETLHRVNVKDFRYALGFRLKGCNKEYYIPCRDKNAIDLLSQVKPNTLLSLTIIKLDNLKQKGDSFS